MKTSLALMVMLLILPPPLHASATPAASDVKTIMRAMKAALEPPRPSLRELEVVLRDPQGVETRWTARQARKQGPRGGRVAMVMTSPAEIAGSAMLIAEQPNAPDVQWEYLPAVRRVRKILPTSAFQSLFGTDFTYGDLGFVTLDRRSIKLLGTEMTAGGVAAYTIEETPDDNWYYSRILDFVAVDTMLPLRRQFFTPANDLWKTEAFESVARVDGVPTPMLVRMEDRLEGGSSELRVRRIRYDSDIPEDVFEPVGLPTLLNNPVWTSTK